MTKYVLNSGGFRNYPDRARQFMAEMLEGQGNQPKILISIFAETRETWKERYGKTVDRFRQFLPEGIQPEYEIASDDDFPAQVSRNDIVFFYGGDVEVLAARLSKFDVLTIFEGKTVAGTSYSSNSSSDGSYSYEIYCPHFGANDDVDWDQVLVGLSGHVNRDLPVYAMKEGEFFVIEQ